MEINNKIVTNRQVDLQRTDPSNLTFEGNVDNANLNFGVVNQIFGCSPDSLVKDSSDTSFTPPPVFVRSRYNLIVTKSDNVGSRTVSVPVESFLEDTDRDIKDELYFCDEGAIAKLITYPSLFALSDSNKIKSRNSKRVLFGYISNVKVDSNYVVCSFNGLSTYDRQYFLEKADLLDIGYAPARTEFDRPHWAVKNKDLIDLTGIAGQFLSIFGINDGGDQAC